MDIRMGTDVEFGQSIYEPFGIAQLEPLTFGGICVVSNVCGCMGFLRDVTEGNPTKNVIVADYTSLGDYPCADIEDLLQIDRAVRDNIEIAEAARLATEILDRLPRTEAQVEEMIGEGYRLARNMSWDVVVRKYFLNGLARVDSREVGFRDYLRV
jgi:glycogen synthase